MQQAFEAILRIFEISLARYFIVAGVAFLLCYIFFNQLLTQSKIQAKSATRKDFIREILHSLQTTLVLSLVGFIVMLTPVKKITLVYDNIHDYPTWWIFISLVLSLIIHDTYFYWMHRLLHHPKIFRFAHLLHHKSTNPSPWTSYSFHFIEAWTEGFVLFIIVMIMPFHLITLGLFVLTGFIINVYGHLGYEIAPLWLRKTFIFEMINTSVHHNLHHSKFKGNYGLYFRVWDRLMGTENPDYVKEFDRVQRSRLDAKKTLIKDPANTIG